MSRIPVWLLLAGISLALSGGTVRAEDLALVRVADDQRGFVLEGRERPFSPWGFNYDHDHAGRLIEDYWETEWDKVERDFRSMKRLGANVVRIHLQLGKFLQTERKPNQDALDRLKKLLELAEETGLYLDLTGLGCYHKADVPTWYDQLDEQQRWDTQALFWQAVAATGASSPAVFCYDLMNEPVVSGGKRNAGDWLGPAFGGKHFVQFISLDPQERSRSDVARQWIDRLTTAIRLEDKRHLITVGLVDWSLDRPGLSSGFIPEKIVGGLDFLCVHLYPKQGELENDLKTLKGFAVGKPVVIEETFPLKCSMPEFARFVEASAGDSAGLIGFFWGRTPDELRGSQELGDLLTIGWLEFFEQESKSNPRRLNPVAGSPKDP